jgi:predicted porin
MKKGLLMTSALVAAGTLAIADDAWAQKAANPVSLRLGGYMEQKIGSAFQRQDELERTGSTAINAQAPGASQGTFDQQTESEIHFIGDGRLDNGLVIRAVVELEVTGSPGNMIDEQYLILRNGFGQVILGNEDPVTSLMTTGYITHLASSVGQSLTYDVTPFIPAPAGWASPSPTAGSTHAVMLESYDNDANKVTYVSPRFFGLQVGVSYAPEATQDLQDDGVGNSPPTKEIWSDSISAAANYEITFDQVQIGIAAGWGQAKGAGIVPNRNGGEDPSQWGGGGRVDFGGLRVLAGYKRTENMVGLSPAVPTNNLDGEIWNIGVRYNWGPNGVSFNYSQGSAKALTNPGEDELDLAILSYARQFAPGIKWTINLMYADYQNEDNVGTSTSQQDFDGFALVNTWRIDW